MLQSAELFPKSNTVKNIVVLLHGYGASGDNLIDLAYGFEPDLPDTLFIAPNAPEECDMCASGYQWFGLADFNPFNIRQGLQKATPIVISYIQSLMDKYDVSAQRVCIVGFSQGAITALDLLFYDMPIAAIVAYSGAFYPPQTLELPKQKDTKILLVHGTHDTVVPYSAMLHAQATLQNYGMNVQTITCNGLDHSIDANGVRAGIDTIKHALTVR